MREARTIAANAAAQAAEAAASAPPAGFHHWQPQPAAARSSSTGPTPSAESSSRAAALHGWSSPATATAATTPRQCGGVAPLSPSWQQQAPSLFASKLPGEVDEDGRRTSGGGSAGSSSPAPSPAPSAAGISIHGAPAAARGALAAAAQRHPMKRSAHGFSEAELYSGSAHGDTYSGVFIPYSTVAAECGLVRGTPGATASGTPEFPRRPASSGDVATFGKRLGTADRFPQAGQTTAGGVASVLPGSPARSSGAPAAGGAPSPPSAASADLRPAAANVGFFARMRVAAAGLRSEREPASPQHSAATDLSAAAANPQRRRRSAATTPGWRAPVDAGGHDLARRGPIRRQ